MPLIYAASSPTGIRKPESLRRRSGHRDSVNVRGVLSPAMFVRIFAVGLLLIGLQLALRNLI
jgi:hypothetical protein